LGVEHSKVPQRLKWRSKSSFGCMLLAISIPTSYFIEKFYSPMAKERRKEGE